MCCAIFLLLLLAPATSLEIVCGPYHNCVFERGQEAMTCWGLNDAGQLGYGDNNWRGDAANEMGSNLPLLNIGTGFTVEAMTLGSRHSCAMSDDRAAKCFGSNAYSQLGFDGATTTGDALPFLEFGVDFTLSKIAAGQWHTCTLSTDAALKCFGYNDYGQCGAGTTTTRISGPPSQINAIDFGTNFTPVDVHTFYDHVCVLSQQQTVKCFGDNNYGQLGYGDTTDRGNTTESMGDGLPIVDLGSDFIVAVIATGRYHSCALSTTKTVKCWGCGGSTNFGQCGTPHSTETGDNLPVLEFGADFVPMQLALGAHHTCILSEAAALICFGYNAYGQLGICSATDVDTPSTLTGIDLGSNFVPRQVAAGWLHTCAVSTGDAIKCWGANEFGQLGIGATNNMGDGPNEMGDNLPFVCLDCTEAPTTAAPSTAPTAPPSTEPTKAPTGTTISVTIRTDSLSSTQILIAIANAYNLSSTTLSSSDDANDGFATVELLVAVASNVELDYDVIEATLREAMVDEYGEDIQVDIDVHGDDDNAEGDAQSPETSALSWEMWVIAILGSIVVCVCCVAAVGLIYVRRQRNKNAVIAPPAQPAAVPPPPQQIANIPGVSALAMTRVVSHSSSQVVPGAVAAAADDDDDDDDERKQGEEDVELEMASGEEAKEQPFVSLQASLVTATAAIHQGVVAEEKSENEDNRTPGNTIGATVGNDPNLGVYELNQMVDL